MRSQPRNATLVFLHLPKTGGTTVRQIIERNYRRGERHPISVPAGSLVGGMRKEDEPEVEGILKKLPDSERVSARAAIETRRQVSKLDLLPEERKRTLRIIYGHTNFGVHEALPGPTAYITMLREPTSRVLSTYHFLRRRPQHWLHEEARRLSPEEFVRTWMSRRDNLATRMISGELANPDRCTVATLERAKQHIDEHFASVGLTERFDETILLWGKILGWRKPHYVPVNVTRGEAPEPVPSNVISLIEELSELDAELYLFAKERFEEQLSRYPSLESDVARFRRRNEWFQKLYPTKLKPFLRAMKRAILR